MSDPAAKLIEGSTGIGAPLIVYTIEPSSWGKKVIAKRFLGCAFPLAGDGLLGTCEHVVSGIDPAKEMIVVQHPTESVCHKVSSPLIHPKHDFALIRIEAKTPHWPSPILGELLLAIDVFAYGYYDTVVEDGNVVNIPQVYSGIITATPRRFKTTLRTTLPFYQLSFPALVGFSGSALYAKFPDGNFALAGMIFGNVSSQIVERLVTESEDENSRVIEKVSRIWESGVAHTTMAMAAFAKDLGQKIWNLQ